jgi:DNA-binding transcriptional regulator YiaG
MEGEELKDMREKLRLTKKDLAARLEVTETSLYRWETGRTPIPKTVELAMKQIRRELLDEDSKDV